MIVTKFDIFILLLFIVVFNIFISIKTSKIKTNENFSNKINKEVVKDVKDIKNATIEQSSGRSSKAGVIKEDIERSGKAGDIKDATIVSSSKAGVVKDKSKDIKESFKEKFIVADAEDFHNYQEHKDAVLAKADNFQKEELIDPQLRRIVDYDKDVAKEDEFSIKVDTNGGPYKPIVKRDKKAYVTDIDFGWDPPKQYVSCSNSSVAQRFLTGKKSLLPMQISCDSPNKLTAENYYNTHYKAQIVPIEDYLVKGYNYLDYTNKVSPYEFRDLMILSENTKGLAPKGAAYKNIPSGFNYAFFNTPAMPMP